MADTRTIPDDLTDEEIDAVARELFCAGMGDKEGDWGPNTLNQLWCESIGRPFARAILARSTVRAPVDAKPDLHAAIMNLPCVLPDNLCGFENESERESYMAGHRDARHAAVELVAASLQQPAQQDAPATQDEHECETCQGVGTIDERLGGYSFSDPAAKCPDCDGKGYHLSGVAAPAGASEILRTGSTLYELNAMGYNRWSALVQPGHDDNDKRISESECERIAAALSGAPAVAAEPLAVLRDLIGCVDTYDRLKRLHEMGHGTDHDSTRCRFAEAVERARELVKAHGIGSPGAKEDGQHG